MSAKHGDGGVGFWWKDIDKCVGVAVESDGGGWLELLAIEGGKDANDIVGAG